MPGTTKQLIDAKTRYCAVYGHPVKHSASPAFQNAGITALELNWRYLAFDVHPHHLKAAIEGARAMKYVGLNLTVPHKLFAVPMVDHLDASAKKWGAVNTIRFEARDESGNWKGIGLFPDDVPEFVRTVGFNTDADAIERSLTEDLGVRLKGASVLLLGAGGAGSGAALKFADAGVDRLFLVNRTASKAEKVAREIQHRHPQVKTTVGYPTGSVDLMVNATSLGLRADDTLPLDENKFPAREARAAYDMIYRPAETPFLARAKAAGCRTANGLGMLLYQGVAALELWTGAKPPIDIMRAALKREVYGHLES